MATTLTLSDGTTSADLFSLAGTFPTEWALATPDAQAEAPESIADVINVLIQAASGAALQTAVRTIERLLQAAARRARTGLGPRVFVNVQWDGEATGPWRSEIYGGRLDLEEAPNQWGRLKVTGALGLTRAPWWEGPETELQISANGQSAATGGRTLTNNGTANWFEIAAAQVAGSLPSPMRLQVANAVAGDVSWNTFYWGLNSFGAPSTFGGVLQGEDQVAGFGTDQSSSEASGGFYNTVSVTTTGAWRNAWLLPTAMTAAGGRWFRMILRAFPSLGAQMKLRAAIFDASGLNTLWQGQEVTWNGGLDLIDLGAAPIPPGEWGSGYGQVQLRLFSQVVSGTYGLAIDYLALLGTDGLRVGKTPGMVWANGSIVMVDEIEGVAYGQAGGVRYPYLTVSGKPLLLEPATTQRVVQLAALGTFTGSRDHTYTVRAYYRPRRATL